MNNWINKAQTPITTSKVLVISEPKIQKCDLPFSRKTTRKLIRASSWQHTRHRHKMGHIGLTYPAYATYSTPIGRRTQCMDHLNHKSCVTESLTFWTKLCSRLEKLQQLTPHLKEQGVWIGNLLLNTYHIVDKQFSIVIRWNGRAISSCPIEKLSIKTDERLSTLETSEGFGNHKKRSFNGQLIGHN